MMELKHITAGYGGAPVLKDVSLCVQPGQITALVGPNGCGKSTLLRVAGRLLEPERGEILLHGRDAAGMTGREYARQVALLPQSRPVSEIEAGALVLHGRFPYLGYPRRYSAADRQAARRAMELTGVSDLEREIVSKLSGGQRQRVYLAMAVAQDTPILLLDEPTTFLDISCQLEILALARRLAQEGKAVLTVLHDLNLALTCADRVAVMAQGEVQMVETARKVYESGALERIFGVDIHPVSLADGSIQYLFTRKS